MTRVWIIARVTLHEALRKKILAMALAAGVAFLVLFATGVHFQTSAFEERHVPAFARRQMLSGMLMLGMYAINFLVVAMTVLIAVDTLSGEIASGTIQAMATKPVRRSELLTGKWLGFCVMLTAYIVAMVLGVNELMRLMGGVSAHRILPGLGLIWMESMLLLAVTFLFGTAFSTLTTGVLVLGLHGLAFLGGWIEQAGALTKTPGAVMVGIATSVLMPSEALWRRAVFEMQSPLVTASNVTPFSGASVPSHLMIAYAAAYALLMLAWAIRRLSVRDL